MRNATTVLGSARNAKTPKPQIVKKKKIKNKAPRTRVPNIGNTNSAGMWGI